jgi:glycosyltransferase involved in cell wall biosynthesis
MNILFVHQNFPGQFKHLAPVLGADPAHRVVAFTMRDPVKMPGVQVVQYRPGKGNTPGVHPWVSDIEAKVIRGAVAFKAALKMRDEHGFTPDLIFAHHGWGEALFLKEVWPRARLLLYCEWYYPLQGADTNFDPEFHKGDPAAIARLRMKNAHNLLSYEMADAGLSPTHWQASTHPAWFRPRIEVIHDGVDTRQVGPAPQPAALRLPIPADAACGIAAGEVVLNPGDEIVSFVNRNLEPYRGYHIFMRALPELLRRRPRVKVVIVGGSSVSYGAPPDSGTWKQRFLDEVRGDLDMRRVHFVGNLPYVSFLRLLQITTVHAYLTYPFVLSWSLIEAMACAGAIVASDTAPVREVITEGETGRLVNFFSTAELNDRICELLDDPAQRARLGAQARELVVSRYDLHTRCLPAQLDYVRRVAAG